ncbi:MAG: four helix bundle protein [Bacteroidaceae bacterium]|nr:four helix bundle protein [Bacteroidaceae bacterium]
MANRTLENLRIWIDARELVSLIYKLMADNRDYGFKDQIQRASVSIMNNIAEGFEYNSDSVFVRYLNIAKGSCSEVKSMLYLCEDLGYCSPDQRVELQAKILNVSSGIYNMILYLSQSKSKSNSL